MFLVLNENTVASVQQARPCPTLGRPVHLRGGAPRLRPGTSPHALWIPGTPALRELRAVASAPLGCVRLSSLCPFMLIHTFLSPGQRGVIPAFGYGAPHSSTGDGHR
jgi:hypothetical protein